MDVYRVLAYPSGYIMHFRYSYNLVSEKIKEFEDLKEKSTFAIAAIKISSTDDKKIFKFLPIRKGKIIDIDDDGEALHIYFELLEWVDYRNNHNSIDDKSSSKIESEYNEVIKNYENPESDKFISFGSDFKINISTEDKAWVSVIDRIIKYEPYSKNSIFYKINDLIKMSGEKTIEIEKFDNKSSGYILKRDRDYIIDISYNFRNEPPENAEKSIFMLESNEDLNVLPNNIKLNFRVDKKRFYITPKTRKFKTRTMIKTKINNSIEGAELEIPLIIKKSKFIFSLYLILFSAGIIFVGLPIQDIIISTIFKIAGALCTTIATFLINYYTKW